MDLTPHPYHQGLYLSPDGKVFKELATSTSTGGYSTVKIPHTVRLHRLIIETFVGLKPFPKAVVRHLDGNSANNAPENLAWGTQSENMADAVEHGTTTRGERNTQAKLTLRQAQELYDRAAAGESNKTLAEEFDISPQAVCDLKYGRTWPELER